MSSATGGYSLPSFTQPLPRQLSLDQFIQTVLVGISGVDGTLVRPKYQAAPAKEPDLSVDWISFGIISSIPDANGWIGMDQAGVTTYQRQEGLEVACGFHGPNSLDMARQVRDGFQIPQNLDALRSADMGFTSVSTALRVPELVNERWFDRYEMSVYLRRETIRKYAIVSLVSASGTIHAASGNEVWLNTWSSTGE